MAGDDYEIGYGKPPKATQFQPGQTGNPKGRPKGSKNLKTELEEELQEQIAIKEQGKVKKISKQRAMIKSLMAKAAQGDAKSANLIVGMVYRLLGAQEHEEDEPEGPTAADTAILQEFKAMVLAAADKKETPDA